MTWYSFGQGPSAVHCSFPSQAGNPDRIAHVATGDGAYFAALNTRDYNTAAACGACVEVTREDTGAKVVATVVDECPSSTNTVCRAGHIDLSKAAFAQLGDPEREGYLGTGNGAPTGRISWKFVPCPVEENVSIALKEPGNLWWNEFRVQGHRTPVQKLEVFVDGRWVQATRRPYNYFGVDGYMGMGPWRVRVTDVFGETIEATLDPRVATHATSAQFPACQ